MTFHELLSMFSPEVNESIGTRTTNLSTQIWKRYCRNGLLYQWINCEKPMHRYTRRKPEQRQYNARHSIPAMNWFCPLTVLPPSLGRRLLTFVALVNHLAKLENRSIFVSRRRESVLMLVKFRRSAVPTPLYCPYLIDMCVHARTSVRASAHDCASHDALDPHAKRGRVNRFWCFDLVHPMYIYNARPRRIACGNARIFRSR